MAASVAFFVCCFRSWLGETYLYVIFQPFCNFMFGLLLDNKTAAEAALKITTLKTTLRGGGVRFGDNFPLPLTDNSGEFANVLVFTQDLDGEPETDLFFCDPNCAFQKPRVEKNHTIFRDIVPKGRSFDCFTQETVNLIFSHVNGTKRKVLNGKTPYEMFSFLHSKEVAALLGITQVATTEIVQSPLLLKSKTPLTQKPQSDGVEGCFS